MVVFEWKWKIHWYGLWHFQILTQHTRPIMCVVVAGWGLGSRSYMRVCFAWPNFKEPLCFGACLKPKIHKDWRQRLEGCLKCVCTSECGVCVCDFKRSWMVFYALKRQHVWQCYLTVKGESWTGLFSNVFNVYVNVTQRYAHTATCYTLCMSFFTPSV